MSAHDASTTSGWRVSAPAKVNLSLLLGPARPADGRHRLVTVFESLSLADTLTAEERAAGEPDLVVCPGVAGENLAATALARLRTAGWRGPGLRIEIDKRIPVAGGMGGGSADAAAALRLAAAVAPLPAGLDLAALAAGLGADVPSQLAPGVCLGVGAGELVAPLPPLPAHALVVVPLPFGLSTAEVYREADRLGLGRGAGELDAAEAALRTAGAAGDPLELPADLLVNDLAPAAVSLRPEVGEAVALLREAGAEQATVSGSGPTVFGILWGECAGARAHEVAARLRSAPLTARATVATPVAGADAAPARLAG